MRYPAIEGRLQNLEGNKNTEREWYLAMAATQEEMDEKVAAAPPGCHILQLWRKCFRRPEDDEPEQV
jgi:hypothetical protein